MQCSLTEPRGLVEKQADPSDGRKSLVSATAGGRQLGRDPSLIRQSGGGRPARAEHGIEILVHHGHREVRELDVVVAGVQSQRVDRKANPVANRARPGVSGRNLQHQRDGVVAGTPPLKVSMACWMASAMAAAVQIAQAGDGVAEPVIAVQVMVDAAAGLGDAVGEQDQAVAGPQQPLQSCSSGRARPRAGFPAARTSARARPRDAPGPGGDPRS